MPSTNSRPKPDTSEDDLRPPYTLFTQPRRREFSGVRIAPVQTAPANIAEANFREFLFLLRGWVNKARGRAGAYQLRPYSQGRLTLRPRRRRLLSFRDKPHQQQRCP